MIDPCDRRRSPGRLKAVPDGKAIRFHMEVRGLGVLIVSMDSDPTDPQGKLWALSSSLVMVPGQDFGPEQFPPLPGQPPLSS